MNGTVESIKETMLLCQILLLDFFWKTPGAISFYELHLWSKLVAKKIWLGKFCVLR